MRMAGHFLRSRCNALPLLAQQLRPWIRPKPATAFRTAQRSEILRWHSSSETRHASHRVLAVHLDTAGTGDSPPGSRILCGNDGGGSDSAGEYPRQAGILTEAGSQPETDEVLILDVRGMHCGSCVRKVRRLLEEHSLVTKASVNLSTEMALAEVRLPTTGKSRGKSNDERLQILGKELAQILSRNGFESSARAGKEGSSAIKSIILAKREERIQRLRAAGKRLAVAWLLASACWAGHLVHLWPHAPAWLHVLGSVPVHAAMSALALLGPGRQILADGWLAIRRRSPDMNSLVALGACSSFAVSCVAASLPALGWRTFFEEPAMLLGVVLVGRTLEERAKLQASSDMTALQALLPDTARLELGSGSSWKTVPASVVSPGNVVRVLPGDCIPADGQVVRGRSSVDESALTGEPMPVTKQAGSTVTAGTVNCDGSLSVLVQRSGEETAMADIVKAVESAQARAAPIQRVADAVAGRFAVGVMVASAATFAFWATLGPSLFPQAMAKFATSTGGASSAGLLLSLQLACNVLVVACPCALGLAAPTAVLVGTSAAARRGLLIRGGDILEAASHIDTVIFDKTGTLTLGKPSLVDIKTAEGFSRADVLAYAAAIERHSSHPLARAIASTADSEGALSRLAEEGSLQQEPGSGILGRVDGATVAVGNSDWIRRQDTLASPSHLGGSASDEGRFVGARLSSSHGASTSGRDSGSDRQSLAPGHSAVYVSIDGRPAGMLHVADTLRPHAWETVQALRRRGIRVGMLSGDQPAAAQHIAASLGIDPAEVFAGVKPAGKADMIARLKQEGRNVAMVGDGINDATALATAHVGIAMGGGVGAASQVASIVLLGDRLPQVLDAIHTSKATFRKIRQNLGWAFTYNVVAIPVAAGALLPSAGIAFTPSLAGAMMGFSSLAVMLNSILLHWDRPASLAQHVRSLAAAADRQRRRPKADRLLENGNVKTDIEAQRHLPA